MVLLTATPVLQWGRDLATTEGPQTSAAFDRFGLLQWGRDLATTEGTPAEAKAQISELLQWGRDLATTEGLLRRAAEMAQKTASMGP